MDAPKKEECREEKGSVSCAEFFSATLNSFSRRMISAPSPSAEKKINWVYITPLFLTALPLIRIGLRHNPRLRDRVFYGAVGVGLLHGTWLITRSEKSDEVPEEFMRVPPPTRPMAPPRLAASQAKHGQQEEQMK